MMAWNNDLEGQSLEIASSDERRIRVVAGPGSGKTFSLTRKIARLLENGVDPQKILLITFTQTAAQGLKKELMKLGVGGVEKVWAGTLYNFCYNILCRETVIAVTGRNPRPLFNYETEFIINDLQHKNQFYKGQIQKKLNNYGASLARLQPDTDDKTFREIIITYLKLHKSMLVEEIVDEALKYLKNSPYAEEQKMYEYVFADEYQDLNRAEQELINLVAKNGHLMIIGDDNQSIYQTFRNAHPEGIRIFHQRHEGTIDYPLTVCHRCPAEIVKAANAFIQNNFNHQQRFLIPKENNPAGKIHAIRWPTFEEEWNGLAAFIKKRIEEGTDPGQILVICPTMKTGHAIREKLITNEIEAHNFFNEEIFNHQNARIAMTLLNLVVNKYDPVALRCWLGFGSLTANVHGYENVMNYCQENYIEIYDAIQLLCDREIYLSNCNDTIRWFRELHQELDKLKNKKASEIIAIIFPKNEAWALPFHEILTKINDEEHTPADIQNEIRSNFIHPEIPHETDYVRITNMHKSKGLTADITIICGAIEGLIPRTDLSLDSDAANRFLEEQRRLFFVGITRAKKELVISTVSKIKKKLANSIGLKVHPGISTDMKSAISPFLYQLGHDFPGIIAGENWKY
jgi:ATP-dependent DNA helicase UvrD/PcrA